MNHTHYDSFHSSGFGPKFEKYSLELLQNDFWHPTHTNSNLNVCMGVFVCPISLYDLKNEATLMCMFETTETSMEVIATLCCRKPAYSNEKKNFNILV